MKTTSSISSGESDERAALIAALTLAEAALADIGDADREPGDDLAWCEQRAAEALPAVRAALAAPAAAVPESPAVHAPRLTDEALAEEMADAECDENESSWKYLGRAERDSWLAAARRAEELLKGGV